MNKSFKFLLGISLIFTLFAACSKSTFEETNLEMGYEYFPLEIGKYKIYQVDSVIYDTTGSGVTITNSTSFIQEKTVDTLLDNIGRVNYKIERFWRKAANEPWQLQDVWLTNRTDQTAERVEENLRFIKMVFPLTAGRSWDGNVFIDKTSNISVAGETIEIFKNWQYEIVSVGEMATVGDTTYDEVAEIIQADSENFIELRSSREQYAKGLGLIYRKMRILDTQRIDENEPWESKAQKGFILTQWLLEYN